MNREAVSSYLPLLKLLIVGCYIGSIIVGGLALNAVLLTLLVAALLVVTRADILQAIAVILIGAVLIILFKQLSFAALPTNTLILCVMVILML